MRNNWFCKYKLAHRGLHNETYPENSIGAFENAMNHGFAIELDVRLLKDNTVVVFHDDNLYRMCGENIELKDLTLAELEKYKLYKTNYTIPTLQEVLDLINGKTPIMIELKPLRAKERLHEKVYNIIQNYSGDLAVKSFNPYTILWFKKHAPNVLRGMLSSFFDGNYLPWIYKVVLKNLYFFGLIKPDFISYNIDNLPNKYVSSKKVPVLAWTIRSKEQEEKALEIADNVIFENYIPENPTNY